MAAPIVGEKIIGIRFSWRSFQAAGPHGLQPPQRREAAEKEAANRRATNAQVLEDAERLILLRLNLTVTK
jgi:hypothetical protein